MNDGYDVVMAGLGAIAPLARRVIPKVLIIDP